MLLAHSRKQRVGNLDQDAGAVAHQRVRAHRAAMVEIDEKLQALADDAVGFLAFDVGDKAHAAGIMFVPGIVKTLFLRQAHGPQFLIIGPPKRAGPVQTRKNQSEIAFCTHTSPAPVAAQHGGRRFQCRT